LTSFRTESVYSRPLFANYSIDLDEYYSHNQDKSEKNELSWDIDYLMGDLIMSY
jgi:hypothetical protein